MFFPVPPSVTVLGVKVNAMSDSANLTIGPSAVWGLYSLGKNQQFTQISGDFGYGPMWSGVILDNDVWDSPMADYGVV